MLPNIRNGFGFNGAGLYYLHDKLQEGEKVRLSTDRVDWAYTLNCAQDDPELAFKEMIATAYAQNVLKEAAGVPLSGRKVQEVVKTISLSWHPDERPDEAEIKRTAENFLAHMGWSEHQAVLVSHNDTPHKHVHIIVNRIHPETGLVLNDRQDEVRSQQWALAYEQEQGQIRCPDREAKYERGEAKAPSGVPREVWRSWNELAIDLDRQQEVQQRQDAAEWDLLKQHQRDERDSFQDETKALIRAARSEAYRAVKDEFKPEWRDWYQLQKDGADRAAVAEMRQDILGRQREATRERQAEAIGELKEGRSADYQSMLASHRDERRELTGDQRAGITRYDPLALAHPPAAAPRIVPEVSGSAIERHAPTVDLSPSLAAFTGRQEDRADERGESRSGGSPDGPGPKRDAISGIADGLLTLFDRIADSVTGGSPQPEPRGLAGMEAEQRAISAWHAREEANRQQGRRHAEELEEERQRYDRSRDRERER